MESEVQASLIVETRKWITFNLILQENPSKVDTLCTVKSIWTRRVFRIGVYILVEVSF